jgi:pantoate--beta-alanine ligase
VIELVPIRLLVRIIHDNSELGPLDSCVFVPTMGALHEGHFALVREAVRVRNANAVRKPVVVSIFVNPTQFNDPKDLERYPRTLEADAAGCEQAGADAIYTPRPEHIYPPGQTIPTPPLPSVATMPGLEDAHRPGHFAGVCQVVHRLFDLLRPSHALFGEKDWQQLAVIRAMTAAERLPVSIHGIPTIREPDGLAMSSRNVFLKPDERARAAAMFRALNATNAEPTSSGAEHAMNTVLRAAGLTVEYACVREADTLLPLTPEHLSSTNPHARALIAARLGSVRLIDNAPWHPSTPSR